MYRRTIRFAALLATAALVVSAVALAAPGGKNASSSSIRLASSSASAVASDASDGPSFGDSVTFDVSTDATQQPFVHLMCFQSGSLVQESKLAWAYSNRMFRLGGSPAWQSGAADCRAVLENWDSYSKNGRTTALASTSFHVDA